jgi:ketosteroid isomerase-like protein
MSLSTEDHLAILNLANRYGQAFDFGDPEAYANCFTPDGIFDAQPVILANGHEELRNFCAGSGEEARRSRHWMGNTVVDGDGDEAMMTTYLMMVNTGADSSTGVTGVYRDKLVKQNGEWKIQHRKLTFEEPPHGFE